MKTKEIILWRHADAEPLSGEMDDLERALSDKGRKQAKRMAKWLNQRLHDQALVLSSPALRATQTADALQRKYQLEKSITPNATAQAVLKLIIQQCSMSNKGRKQIVLIGHQPWIGQVAASLLELGDVDLEIKKGAAWWLSESKDEPRHFKLLTVMSPSLL